jgi:hypothetical protein
MTLAAVEELSKAGFKMTSAAALTFKELPVR